MTGLAVALLTDRACIVTGAGQGLGAAIAAELAAEGATVHLLERDRHTLEQSVAAISDAGGHATGHCLDVTDHGALRAAVDAIGDAGPIHALVNNAAVNPPAASILGVVLGILVLDGEWVDQLYVDPDLTGRGIGADLLAVAKRERPDGLRLWTFASNTGAQRFYERHGFIAVRRTDGRDNEERAPDILYELQTPS